MTLAHFATTIDEDIMKQFRHVVYVKYGLRKGDISKALTEAVLDYIEKNSANNLRKEDDKPEDVQLTVPTKIQNKTKKQK